jgi:RsiW-degrading membrane proteinase PrsW (M82 family)
VEELAKAFGLVALLLVEPRALAGVVPGIVAGALVGLGFTTAENVGYLVLAAVQGGPPGLERALWVRAALGGFTHAVFTAAAGAGLGWARGPLARGWSRAGAPAAGLALAVLQHALWNAVVSPTITEILCNPVRPDGPCREAPEPAGLLVTIPLVVAAGLAPGAAGLAAAVAWARRRPAPAGSL